MGADSHFARRSPQPRAALLDYASMTIHSSFDGLACPPRLTLVAGFERNGYFYTRSAAERAAQEWP